MFGRPIAVLLLTCCATVVRAAPRDCGQADRLPPQLVRTDHGVALDVLRCIRGTDPAGGWQLYLLGDAVRREGDLVLSTRLAAQMFRRGPDGTLVQHWLLRDRSAPGEAGAWFSRKLSEFDGLDAGGMVAPLLVLRFVSWKDDERKNGVDEDDDAGRLKIVLPGTEPPATVVAITSPLDDERRTTANDAWFAQPEATRRHVERLLRDWTRDQVFLSADNGGTFVPRREKRR